LILNKSAPQYALHFLGHQVIGILDHLPLTFRVHAEDRISVWIERASFASDTRYGNTNRGLPNMALATLGFVVLIFLDFS
jgi:hypothetical protein